MERHDLPLRSNARYDIWRCTACQAPLIYRRSGKHAGPAERGLDRRYAFGTCFRASEAWPLVKDQPHARSERVIFRHDSRPQSSQPEQASSLASLPSSWKDPSRTYGTFPGHGSAARLPRNTTGARSVVVPLAEPRGGTLRVTALVSTGTGPSSSKDDPATPASSLTDT